MGLQEMAILVPCPWGRRQAFLRAGREAAQSRHLKQGSSCWEPGHLGVLVYPSGCPPLMIFAFQILEENGRFHPKAQPYKAL